MSLLIFTASGWDVAVRRWLPLEVGPVCCCAVVEAPRVMGGGEPSCMVVGALVPPLWQMSILSWLSLLLGSDVVTMLLFPVITFLTIGSDVEGGGVGDVTMTTICQWSNGKIRGNEMMKIIFGH